mmetsp:Transcript_48737/g.116006  ORF Transcript_48737/g.116006 Transcript_48737/m.116006 type:complete len:208 (+) Transcript_48737:345-968(+)
MRVHAGDIRGPAAPDRGCRGADRAGVRLHVPHLQDVRDPVPAMGERDALLDIPLPPSPRGVQHVLLRAPLHALLGGALRRPHFAPLPPAGNQRAGVGVLPPAPALPRLCFRAARRSGRRIRGGGGAAVAAVQRVVCAGACWRASLHLHSLRRGAQLGDLPRVPPPLHCRLRYRGVRADLDAALLHPGRDRARRPATPRDNPQAAGDP